MDRVLVVYYWVVSWLHVDFETLCKPDDLRFTFFYHGVYYGQAGLCALLILFHSSATGDYQSTL